MASLSSLQALLCVQSLLIDSLLADPETLGPHAESVIEDAKTAGVFIHTHIDDVANELAISADNISQYI